MTPICAFGMSTSSHVMTFGNAIRIAVAAVLGMTALSVVLACGSRASNPPCCFASCLADRSDDLDDRLLRRPPHPAIPAGAGARALPARLLNVQAFVSTPLALGLRDLYRRSCGQICKDRKAAFGLGCAATADRRRAPRDRSAMRTCCRVATRWSLMRQNVIETRILDNPSPAQEQREAFWREVRTRTSLVSS